MNDKTKEPSEVKPAEAPATATAPAEQPVELTVSDLNNLKQIIDVASSRGAFRGAELTQVGAVYDKLFTFLKAVSDANEEAGEEGAEVDGE